MSLSGVTRGYSVVKREEGMRGSVEELLDIATDSFEDGERCPNVCVAVSKALRLALGGDCVENAIA